MTQRTLPIRPSHPVTEQELAFIVAHPELTTVELAERLHTTHNHILHCRRRLRTHGKVPQKADAGLLWSAADDAHLKELAEQGLTVHQIAGQLHRTPAAVHARIIRIGGFTPIRQNPYATLRSARQVADLMGVNDLMVLGWLQRKWLKGRRNRNIRTTKTAATRRHYLITDEMLLNFLEDRRWWPAWTPARMTDRDWRETAQSLRDEAGGAWLSLADVSERYHVAVSSARNWWTKGVFAELTTTTLGRTHYVWSADLVGFVPPYDRPLALKKRPV